MNQGNLTSSYRPNSGGIKENKSKPMTVLSKVELVAVFLQVAVFLEGVE